MLACLRPFRFLLACAVLGVADTATVAAEPANLVRAIKVLPDKAPDCSSLKSIVETVTRGCRTNDEKAIAIYNFMRMTHYHRAYPSERGGIPVLKEINCYGWSLCGGLHAEQSALWRELGWNWRFVGWPGHTTVEAFYDGRWHYLDVFLKLYAWMPDPNNPSRRTIAGEDDLAANSHELLTDAFVFDPARKVMYAKGNEFQMFGDRANWQAPAFLTCGDDLPGVIDALKKKNRVGPEPGWGGIRHATGDYSTDVNLAPGFSLTSTWDRAEGAWYWAGSQIAPCHTCGDKEIRNSPEKGPVAEPYLGPDWNCESYANGQLVFRPDLSHPDAIHSFAAVENAKLSNGALVPVDGGSAARVTVAFRSPYLLTQASGSADDAAKVVEKFEISVDDGKMWKESRLADFGATVGGQTSALARLTFRQPLKNLRLQGTVQNNPFALPYLSPGKNTIAVSLADRTNLGENRLAITYAYRTGARRKSYEQLFLEGKEIARGHDATWDKTPTVVQKIFSATDLPATFEIDVPTPSGMHPVFPRMLFVRREVLSPGQSPLPLPDGSLPPKSGPGWELKTLPNPLLVGTQPPPSQVVRAIQSTTLDIVPGHFVSKSGEVPTSDMLRWPKLPQEKVEPLAFLIGGDVTAAKLPALKKLAAARLVVPIARSHDKAPTKLGVTALRAPFAPNQPYDFAKLGDVLATTIVPSLAADAAAWNPPREFKFDVTRQIRAIANGDTQFHGFALRIVPDRTVDDGWTVRVNLPKTPRVRLELDAYVD